MFSGTLWQKMKYKYHLLAFSAVFFWGISLLSTRILLDSGFTPNNITFFRFLIAGSLIFFFRKNKKKTRIEKKDRKYFYLTALCGVTLFYYFENTGLKFTTVSNTALITATIPLFTLLIAFSLLRKKMVWQNLIGIPLGLGGTFILFYKDILDSGIHLKGDIFVFGSVIMWTIYSFVYKKIMHKYNVIFFTYKVFLYGVIFLIPFMVFEYKSFINIKFNVSAGLHLLFLSVLCSCLGYYFWNLAVKNIGIKVIANLILLIPIVSITCGIIFLNEPFSINLIISTVLIMLGAFLTSISDEKNRF